MDMKLSKKEAESMLSPAEIEAPEYPYGLQIRLEDEQLTKLGINSLPQVGKEFPISGKVTVCSVSQHESEGGKPHRCVSLQITDLSMNDEKEVEDKLYGE